MKVKSVTKGWRFPESSERQLGRSIQKAIASLVVEMRRRTKAMKFDATESEINDAERSITDYAIELIGDLLSYLPAIALSAYKFNAKQWINVAKSSGGGNEPSVILLISFGAKGQEEWYKELYGQWEGLTEASLKKLFENIVSDWSTNVRNANFTNKSEEQVNELAEKRFIVYRSWGNNRAGNIIGSWNSRLMRQRLIDANVTHYFWRGMLDDRERLQHVKWEGKRISINEIHDFPGEPFGCRCWAQPDFNKRGE